MRILLISAVLVLVILFQGCTLHFKGKDIEFDAERQRVKNNVTYELEAMAFLHGEAAQ